MSWVSQFLQQAAPILIGLGTGGVGGGMTPAILSGLGAAGAAMGASKNPAAASQGQLAAEEAAWARQMREWLQSWYPTAMTAMQQWAYEPSSQAWEQGVIGQARDQAETASNAAIRALQRRLGEAGMTSSSAMTGGVADILGQNVATMAGVGRDVAMQRSYETGRRLAQLISSMPTTTGVGQGLAQAAATYAPLTERQDVLNQQASQAIINMLQQYFKSQQKALPSYTVFPSTTKPATQTAPVNQYGWPLQLQVT